ncbi:aminopeptidase P family protein [Microbacterium sp. SD291]|uniref:aminopeptidase P family protein n=1 Tax=Microbacterium sp. SD291 TaxID=2782007 RepID=UPI001A97B8AA|nr:aminopeptidase P family protein [Microbacterium sp. SD291]MBO0979346.1 aminopeptidase P family protein [Microbacterium sp. SD291]
MNTAERDTIAEPPVDDAVEIPAEPSDRAAQTGTKNRKDPFPRGFLETISTGWAERTESMPVARAQAPYAAVRRTAVSAAFPGRRLVIPAGSLKQRSNDTDYVFRPHSAFAHLTGWASDSEPDSVLVFEPVDGGHDVTLYFRERADRTTTEFYADATVGEFWIGPRPSLAGTAADLGIATAHLDEFEAAEGELTIGASDELDRFVSELRLIKDEFEIAEMRRAVEITANGFDDVIRALPAAVAHSRGERVVEGVFHRRAREDGNGEGYDTIAASGPHACYLHWTRNDGAVVPGELILLDAGVEADSLYTADITRTLPISGTFSDVQRRVYETVREAADAAFEAAQVGVPFREVHGAAMKVIAARVAEWGLLPVTAEEALDADAGGQHRRYMVHGTSHHLGMDVHDCAQARREMYYDGLLAPGMVFTIEPGLYFQIDDLTVPEELRGIGARIEDDILMTEDGPVNLSAGIPRTADEVEAWIARVQQG